VTCSAQITNSVKSGGSSGSSAGAKPTPAVAAPTAAQLAQTRADTSSAAVVNESLAGITGAVRIPALQTGDTATNSVLQAQRDAAAILAERLAYTGIEAAIYLLLSIIALVLGGILFVAGRRGKRPVLVTT
jgi:hypothetical protein